MGVSEGVEKIESLYFVKSLLDDVSHVV